MRGQHLRDFLKSLLPRYKALQDSDLSKRLYQKAQLDEIMGKRTYAMVCSSNQNRSMEAHALLKTNGFQVESFGSGQKVKLPGLSLQEPVIFDFGTPYSDMLRDLQRHSEEHFRKRGILRMLERNASIKSAPERWQDDKRKFDVAFTFEERVMDQLIEDMVNREGSGIQPLLIVNLDVVDNHEEAATAAPCALRLCQLMDQVEDVYEDIDRLLQVFKEETNRSILHEVCYY